MALKKKHQCGLTLLEVLIAAAILAGIAMGLAPAINAASRASISIHQKSNIAEELRTSRQVFRDVVRQQIQMPSEMQDHLFKGTANEFSFASIDPITMKPVLIELSVTATAPKQVLVRLKAEGDKSGAPYLLLSNVTDAHFEFLDKRNGQDQWRRNWDQAFLPALVRLTGTLQTRGTGRPFLVEAAPLGRTTLNCQFDPVSRQCR